MKHAAKPSLPRALHRGWLDVLVCALWAVGILFGLYALANEAGFSPFVGPLGDEPNCHAVSAAACNE